MFISYVIEDELSFLSWWRRKTAEEPTHRGDGQWIIKKVAGCADGHWTLRSNISQGVRSHHSSGDRSGSK